MVGSVRTLGAEFILVIMWSEEGFLDFAIRGRLTSSF